MCAPTGKAAKKMEESCGIEAKTIHRALEFNPENATFTYNRDNKMDYELIVVDESSMLDISLAASLFESIQTGARIILVGDVDQLPSVGPGMVFSNLIESNLITVTRLESIHRQESTSKIVTLAHSINHGHMPDFDHSTNDNDVWFIERKSDQEIKNEIVSLQKRLANFYRLNIIEDLQTLVPMKKGVVGSDSFKDAIQKEVNDNLKLANINNVISFDCLYHKNDKVMQVVNDYEMGVFNGTTGIVDKIDSQSNTICVKFDNEEFNYSKDDLSNLRLAYAIAIHKSQGSEYPVVIIPLTMSHSIMLNRTLVYTALT